MSITCCSPDSNAIKEKRINYCIINISEYLSSSKGPKLIQDTNALRYIFS